MLQLRSFSTFCICLSLNNYSLTCRVTLSYVLYMPEYVMIYIENSLSDIKNSDIFRHIHILSRNIQSCLGISRTLCNSFISRTLPYSESWHIYNPKYIQKSVKTYSNIFRMLRNACIARSLPYSKLWHIQNFGKFRIQAIFKILLI